MLQQRKNTKNLGFTLLEISIVIGMIAVLIGGIVAAKSIIRTAQMDKQANQIEQIQASIKLFEDKFQCLPGDCADPTAISGYTYAGNGNGHLENTWNDNENKGFWLHLHGSNLLQDPLVTHSTLASMRTPPPSLNKGGFINAFGDINYGQNVLMFATADVRGIFTAAEAIYLDEKMDDGIAASGKIRSTGYGSGATTIYASAPTFPLAITNNNGSDKCVSGGVYSGAASNCNLVYILEK